MSEWNPNMDEAPRDGTPVLLWGVCDGEIRGLADRPSMVVGSSRGEDAFYVDDTDYYSVAVRATHWQPLPSPPAQED